MQNGNSFSAFQNEVKTFLSNKKVIEYFTEKLPSSADDYVFGYCQRFMALPAPEREQFQDRLEKSHRSLFGIFGHRAATIAARKSDEKDEDSEEWLLAGLIGAIISNYVIPERRNVEVGLAVYHHCARKLGISPPELFTDAARFANMDLAVRIIAFGKRADVRLDRFGWQELKTDDGVKYKFNYG